MLSLGSVFIIFLLMLFSLPRIVWVFLLAPSSNNTEFWNPYSRAVPQTDELFPTLIHTAVKKYYVLNVLPRASTYLQFWCGDFISWSGLIISGSKRGDSVTVAKISMWRVLSIWLLQFHQVLLKNCAINRFTCRIINNTEQLIAWNKTN